MIEIARHLRETVDRALPLLNEVTEKDSSLKPSFNKWSQKEILGHLIDSAGNNQQKFVRLMETDNLHFVSYSQEFWVSAQRYNYAKWKDLVRLWGYFNDHLAHIIEFVMPDKLANQIYIDNMGPYTLEFIMKDYVEHMKHHLKQLLPGSGIESKFENIYNS